jgi:UDP-N-acetylglucosamine:LPS N-acetylglucosamine transferase
MHIASICSRQPFGSFAQKFPVRISSHSSLFTISSISRRSFSFTSKITPKFYRVSMKKIAFLSVIGATILFSTNLQAKAGCSQSFSVPKTFTTDEQIQFLVSARVAPDCEFITSINGTRHLKKKYDSEMDEFLSIAMQDSERSEMIYNQYKDILIPSMKNDMEALQIFDKWIKDHYYLLTCCPQQLIDVLKSHSKLVPHFSAITQFLHAIDKTKPLRSERKKIAIIVPCTGVGEEIVAGSVATSLRSHNMAVEIFYNDPKADPLHQFSCMDNDTCWKEVFQKKNMKDLASKTWKIVSVLPKYVADERIGNLRKRVEEFDPDFIITTRYSNPAHASFAAICPIAYLHCDYQFDRKLLQVVRAIDPKRVKFWSVSEKSIPIEFRDRVELLGYPVRKELKKIEDIAKIKEKWNIEKEDRVIMVQMGSQGMGMNMEQLLKTILSSKNELPSSTFVVIAGQNQQMKLSLQELTKNQPPPPHVKIQFTGMLDVTEMNELYNISTVVIGKAGGSTTAEIIHMGLYGLLFPSWRTEQYNVDYIVQNGYGLELSDPEKFITDLRTLLFLPKSKTRPISWEDRLYKLIRE